VAFSFSELMVSILFVLYHSEKPISRYGIAKKLDVSRQAVSYNIKKLIKARLVESGPDGIELISVFNNPEVRKLFEEIFEKLSDHMLFEEAISDTHEMETVLKNMFIIMMHLSRPNRFNLEKRYKPNDDKYYRDNQAEILERKRRHYRDVRGLPEDWDLSKESSIEAIMRKWLQESGIEFIQQHFIDLEDSTWTRVDFYIPEANVCLYCDGDYWHGPLKPEKQESDTRINKTLEVMGYNVIRMTETEILEGNRPWWIGELIPAKW